MLAYNPHDIEAKWLARWNAAGRINTTSPASPWLSGEVAGTRFAAPIVAGEAALMMQFMIRS